ncbi:MAG TPA: DUF192 domain-containing protein [Patescibacteria group bacterium]|nr:DUF192 domain-containing protein [Patescibacteria group bacterium]
MIKNITKNIILARNIKKANSLIDKSVGMISRDNSEGIIFKTRFGIHTFFMRNPIDVIILDNKNIVKKIKTIYPWNVFFWNPKFYQVIELPKDTISNTKTEVGDKLDF